VAFTSDEDDEGGGMQEHAPEPDQSDWNDEPAEVPCPYCKREIPDDAEQCPYCGSYILKDDGPNKTKPWWWIVAVILLVFILIKYLLW
jgi:RNA polymerase subunit RPABC4/transcription elongation factor Spt4